MGKRARRRKNKFRVNRTRVLLLIVIAVVFVMFAFSVKNIVDLHREQAELKAEQRTLTERKEDLEAELKSINESNYIEEQARTQLNMVMPGETLYITEDKDEE